MNSKRLLIILSGILLLVIGGIGGVTYMAGSLLQSKATTLAGLKAQAQNANDLRAELQKNKADIARYSELNAIAESIVPQDKDQAEAVLEIVNLARASGIPKLTSITFPASTLGGTTGTATSSAALTQVTPVPGIPGVFDLKITIAQDNSNRVAYTTFLSFLQKLEQNRRTAQVSTISIQPDSQNPGQVAFSLTIDEYIKP